MVVFVGFVVVDNWFTVVVAVGFGCSGLIYSGGGGGGGGGWEGFGYGCWLFPVIVAGNNNKEWIKNIIFKWDKRIKKYI